MELARLTIDIPVPMHRIIKLHASINDESIRDYVMEALTEKLEKDISVEKKLKKQTEEAIREFEKNKSSRKTFRNVKAALDYLNK